MSDDLSKRKEQVEALRQMVEKDDEFDPGSEELDRLLDRIKEQGYELRKTSETANRSTTLEEFREKKDELIRKAAEIRDAKNPEYSVADEDFHASFRKLAKDLDITEDGACYLLWKKHLLAIASSTEENGVDASEDMEGRFADALNYLFFQYSLYKEKHGG